jgi:signal transduction histidine kinase
MAREIHDQLGQSLTGLKMDVAWLARHADGDGLADRDARRSRLGEMGREIDRIIEEVRRISAELRPGVLDDLGLAAAVEWQAHEFRSRFDIPCAVRSNVHDERFERSVSTAFFRILQEALTNVARHSRARRVDVSLMRDCGRLSLVVQDDGIGIDTRELSASGSLGLLGIRERARRLGGEVVLTSASSGTRLVVDIPLTKTVAA